MAVIDGLLLMTVLGMAVVPRMLIVCLRQCGTACHHYQTTGNRGAYLLDHRVYSRH